MRDIQALLNDEDATGLAEWVRRGEVQPIDLLEAVILRIEQVEPQLNAVAERLYDSARSTALNLKKGEGVFAGVPTLIKDLFSPVNGAVMSNGSLSMGAFRANFDAEGVSRLRRAGCVLVGTSTAPEFGTSYSTESTRFGATRNPWNPDHSAGGSSGGAAALVAARVVPFAHGNDGGGSLRVPASCCGVFGFKPSRGLMPSGPMVGEGWAGLSTSHALTLSVRDSAALLDATAGMDLGAPYAAPVQATPYGNAVRHDPKSLRVALIEQSGTWPTSDESLAAVRDAAQLCESLGHRVERVSLPVVLPEFLDHVFTIIGANTRNHVDLLGRMRGFDVQDAELETRTRIILRDKGDVSGAQYAAAVEWIHALGRRLAVFMQDYDTILSPVLTREPARMGELVVPDTSLSFEELIERSHRYSPFAALFNASGQPAMSVPLSWSAAGLPMGAHFAGRFGEESTLLALAGQLERARPWRGRVPLVNACSTGRKCSAG
ncbi:amidase [Pseudomonas viridiflava]|uniref:amidase n=1 Tax=Pseudomonas viridiflava TaxID=33069 RepID=UPI000C06A204|nr:amidase family protein [Pseudomonas viridiflava]MEE4754817.1 amidase family protein [Pseudomonas alliivorans]MEE4963101.1 amidase family protein [Pseudomonas alliivorans]MEE4972522.1 amidase family protein [Pseudomonas alliivorans]MEE4978325.1 amidase family protein [Pseudomonas alliivorans]MEE4983476.1 amidase family protein [Pseudomonas alliivorans]